MNLTFSWRCVYSSYPHYRHLTKSDVEYSEDVARFYIALQSHKPDKKDMVKSNSSYLIINKSFK
jgi:hypothetical protein